jgi:hypothetical protein
MLVSCQMYTFKTFVYDDITYILFTSKLHAKLAQLLTDSSQKNTNIL